MKGSSFRIVRKALSLAVLLATLGALGAASAQEQVIVERLFRSHLTSITPVFAAGEEGNPAAVIGFDTESSVYEINESIEKGVIPRPRQSGAQPVGRTFGRLRCLGRARVDKSKPMQIFAGRMRFVGADMSFEAAGTAIVHWCKSPEGQYNGIRWTDFSGAVPKVEGRHAGAKGHLVGTRLLIGDPELEGQSGLIITRFLE